MNIFEVVERFLRSPVFKKDAIREAAMPGDRRYFAQRTRMEGAQNKLNHHAKAAQVKLAGANRNELDHAEQKVIEAERAVADAKAKIQRSSFQPASPAEEARLERSGLWVDPRLEFSPEEVGEGALFGRAEGRVLIHTDAQGKILSKGWTEPDLLGADRHEVLLRDVGTSVYETHRDLHNGLEGNESLEHAAMSIKDAEKVAGDYERGGIPAGMYLDPSKLDAARTEYQATLDRFNDISDRALTAFHQIFGNTAFIRE